MFEFQDEISISSKKRMFSSQGTPVRTRREILEKAEVHGWTPQSQGQRQIGCRMQPREGDGIIGNSSTYFFLRIAWGAFANFAALAGLVVAVGWFTPAWSQPTEASVRQGFESILLRQMFDEMRKSGDMLQGEGDNFFSASKTERIYRQMLDAKMVEEMAKREPLGFGDLVVRSTKGESGVGPRTKDK